MNWQQTRILFSCVVFNNMDMDAQAEASFKAGIREVVEYFSRHWMGQTKGKMLYEIPAEDRDLLEDGIVPQLKE